MRVNAQRLHHRKCKPLLPSIGGAPFCLQNSRPEAQPNGSTLRTKCARVGRGSIQAATAETGIFDFIEQFSKVPLGLGQLTQKFEEKRSALDQGLQEWMEKLYYSYLTLLMEQSDDSIKQAERIIRTNTNVGLLHLCASIGHTICAFALLSRGLADANSIACDESTPLYFALANNEINYEMVEVLLHFGADPNVVHPNGFTTLYVAVNQSDKRMVDTLLAYGANPYQPAVDKISPILLAVVTSKPEMLDCLLSEGREPNESDSSAYFALGSRPIEIRPCDAKYGLLCVAAVLGDIRVVEVIMKHTRNVDYSVEGLTPLAVAACNGNLAVVKFLIECGADPYFTSTLPSPLASGAMNGHADVVDYILQRGGVGTVDENQQQMLGLFFASESGFAPVVELFLLHGLTPNYSAEELSPIGAAAKNGHVDAVEVLISFGSYVDGTCDQVHPLYLACHNGHTQVVECLLQAGANPNVRYELSSCLNVAMERSHKEIESLLLSYGANQYFSVPPPGWMRGPLNDWSGEPP